jgi:DNA-binding NarL/FixJ family response regulator
MKADDETADPGPPVRVLICDDNEPIRSALRDVIELQDSMQVIGEAEDGLEAITEAARLQPDVIVLDLAMPRRSGLDALLEIRQVAPAARVLVFTGFSEAAVAADVIELGAVLCLQKGDSIDVIIAAIEQAAAQTALATSVAE